MWCFFACPEYNGDGTLNNSTYLNPGRCWGRIVGLYFTLATHGIVGIYYTNFLIKLLYEHFKKMGVMATLSGKTSAQTGADGAKAKRGFHKTVVFLAVYVFVILGCAAERILVGIVSLPS